MFLSPASMTLRIISALLCAAVIGIHPASASDKDDVLTRVHDAVDHFNKGDEVAFAKDMADAPLVIDEFPPFAWSGPDAFKSWGTAWKAEMERKSIAKAVMKLHDATHIDIRDDRAFVIIPAVCDFTLKDDKRSREAGSLTLVLTKSGSAGSGPSGASVWRISATTWTRH
jgi:hypothetical protein